MIPRIVTLLACCAVASAQLPPPEAAAPRLEPSLRERKPETKPADNVAHLDAVVYDAAGQPVPGLDASEFSLSANGAAQKIESCTYKVGEPLRLVVIVDDLSLSAERNNAARRDLRTFLQKLAPSDQLAILRASAGAGWIDRLTSDPRGWAEALNRASYNPAADNASPDTVGGMFRGVVRGVLDGLREIPGRKAVLVVSERLRDMSRGSKIPVTGFAGLANAAGALVYILDMAGASELTSLDLGLSRMASDTGGVYFNGGTVAAALAQVARDQAGYYLFTYRPENAGYDYFAAAPRLDRVELTSSRSASVRARHGLFEQRADTSQAGERDVDLTRAIGRELMENSLTVRVTPLAAYDGSWRANALVHVDCNNVTLVRDLDGNYRTSLDVVAVLRSDIGAAPEERSARTLDATLTESGVRECRAVGLGYTVTLPLPKPGAYQIFVVAADRASGRLGAARGALAADWGPNKLSLSSIVLHGEIVTGPAGQALQEPWEAAITRRFRPGRKIVYEYSLLNVGSDQEKRSSLDVRARIWRDGVLITDTQPMTVRFQPSGTPSTRAASGMVTLKDSTTPGHYVLGLTVLDKISGRTAAGQMDFEVLP